MNCEECRKENMNQKQGCIYGVFVHQGTQYPRIKYGDSVRDLNMGRDTCPDCGVPIGAYHCIGCDWEECPVCHVLRPSPIEDHAFQFISCDHNYDDDTDFLQEAISIDTDQ